MTTTTNSLPAIGGQAGDYFDASPTVASKRDGAHGAGEAHPPRGLSGAAVDLDAIEARVGAATPGPWVVETDHCDCGDGYGCKHGEFVHAIWTPEHQQWGYGRAWKQGRLKPERLAVPSLPEPLRPIRRAAS